MYKSLFDKASPDRIVQAGIIGTGHFATAIVTQSVSIPRLQVPAVADVNIEAGVRAFEKAGIAPSEIAICETTSEAHSAWQEQKRIVVPDASLLMDLPIDIVVESTGIPEIGARFGLAAIEHGKHLAMVSKDVDIVIGPILKHKADQAGLVYTQVDGDQHGQLIQLVEWLRVIGLEVISAGKFLEFDLILDSEKNTLHWGSDSLAIEEKDHTLFSPTATAITAQQCQSRRSALGKLGSHKGYDVVEMALAANVCELHPDIPELHGLPLRINEVADILCDQERGGILQSTGIVDCVSCLRLPYETAMGGGVFAVIDAASDYSQYIMHSKGLPPNSRGNAATIFQPYHLCGVETATSLLSAVLLNEPTSPKQYAPIYDVAAQANRKFYEGDIAETDKSPDLTAHMTPYSQRQDEAPIPLHLARGNKLRQDVEACQTVTYGDIVAPKESVLWQLREQQDKLFPNH